MEYRRLGKSGLRLSALSFGSWVTFSNQMDEKIAKNCMAIAYEAGVNFFDNAEVYASGDSEVIMGNILKKMEWSRDSYCVSSKAFWGGELPTQRGLSRKHLTDACHAALKRLQVDYLDLFFCHRPDKHTPTEETVRAMHDLITQGKVLYWGTSEWSAEQIFEAHGLAKQFNLTPPTMEQPQYNMFYRQNVEVELNRACSELGMGTTIWSPLASGVLTGKYADGIPEDSRMNLDGYAFLRKKLETPQGKWEIEKTQELSTFAKELGTDITKMAIAWCLKNPHVSTVILGASKSSQVEENLKAMEAYELLNAEAMGKIESILGNRPPRKPFFE
jgi:voltage-dependent potassium channel beta subunit